MKNDAVPFVEYQVSAYQKKIRELEEEIHTLVTIGQENEKIFEGTCRLTEDLLKNQAQDQFFEKAEECVSQRFHLKGVAIWLFAERIRARAAIPEKNILEPQEARKIVKLFDGSEQPICGTGEKELLKVIFKSIHQDVKSYAFVPLANVEGPLGLFALGSSDAEKFFPGMGTVFLTFLGRVLTYLITLRLSEHGTD